MTNPKTPLVRIIGGGLAGVEALWWCLKAGVNTELSEMRPHKMTDAHRTGNLAELVCSNSLKSMRRDSAQGLLKYEMEMLGSLILACGKNSQVAAGDALAVDRTKLSASIVSKLGAFSCFTEIRQEVSDIPSYEELEAADEYWIIATGPLTSNGLIPALNLLCGSDKRLFFYDAIAPIIATESLDLNRLYWANRYNRGSADYLNVPLNKPQYDRLVAEIIAADQLEPRKFEDARFFESCLPIEVMAERGPETLRFGPMKPVGLIDPTTSERSYANIQLRQENSAASMLSMVGFQTRMKWSDQKRIFSSLPGFEQAKFLQYGSIHRNTFLESPKILNQDLSFKQNSRVFLAGQITGVEGYMESALMGMLAGMAVQARIRNLKFTPPPLRTMSGALLNHVTSSSTGRFQPMNGNLGLIPTSKLKGESKAAKVSRAADEIEGNFNAYMTQLESHTIASEH